MLDLVGGPYFPASIEAMAPLGRLMIIGTMAGREATIPLGPRALVALTIRGTMLRNRALEEKIAATRAFEEQVVPLFARGVVRAVVDRELPLAEVRAAHTRHGVERDDRQDRPARHVRGGRHRARDCAADRGGGACTAAVLPEYRGPRTDHFDGRHFFNEEPFEEQQPSELARWQLSRHRGAWPDSAAITAPAPPQRVGGGELCA